MSAQATATTESRGKLTGAERRAARRYRCLSECLVRLDDAPEPLDWPGMVYNISATGVGMALPFPAPVGAVLTLEPRRRGGPRARARIARCALQEFVWFHGCEFVERLSDEDLRRWLRELRAEVPRED
jgi:hypothetical protein